MRTSWDRFNIGHLSASQLNLWRSAPGLYVLRYIAKLKDDGNPAMWRGTAVENGLSALLRNRPLDEACGAALQSFDMNCANKQLDQDQVTAERELIEPMLAECLKWKPPSDLNATQLKVEYFFDPIPIPVIGYLDLAFDGIDVDLKTTKACPSTPRADHVRQVSLYRAARTRSGGLLYVTGKRHAYFDVTDDMMNDALSDLEAAALSLNNFLSRCDTREDAIRSVPIDWDHFAAPKTKVPLADILLGG